MARGRAINIFLRVALTCFLLVSLFSTFPNVAHAANFNVGDTVEVINTLDIGLKVREGPAGNVIGNKPNGSRGVVLSGPTSATLNGTTYVWWKVRHEDGLEGWSAGGYPGGVDYLQKISISPSSEFTIGNSVKVTASTLSVRSDPPDLNYQGDVHNDDNGQVIGGPFYGVPQGSSGFYYFWKIDYGNITGWSAENWLIVAVNQAPTCSVTANPNSGDSPLTVEFTLTANDPDGVISAWVLDVNDDGNGIYSGTGSPPSVQPHTYTLPGTYTVILMASDDDSVSANSITTVNVGSSQVPPTCGLSVSPQSGEAPLDVIFSLTASDSDGYIETWVLDVDEDGADDYTGTGNPSSTISHTYTTAGIHTAVLMVSDDNDLTAAATSAVSVSASSGQPTLSCSPASFSFSAVKNGANPSSQSLNIYNSGDGTLSWTANDGADWLNLSPTAGSSTGETDTVNVSVSISGKDAGTYDAVITVSASGATNSPQSIPVTLTIPDPDAVTFPDALLEAAIRDTLGKSTGDITPTDLAGITILSAPYYSISNLSGLEYCTGLSELNLLNNSVTDISPLAGCMQLYLLTLTGNQVTDISALAGLPALKLVYLGRNQISNVSPLGGLQYLQRVVLFSNQVNDISPLAQNTGIGSGEELDLRTNPLSEVSINTYIPQLQSRGVNVLYDSSISIIHDPASLTFTAVKGGNNPTSQTISVWRSGAGSVLNWTISDDAAWLTASPTSGSSTGEQDTVTVSVNIAGLDSGVYQADITISATGAANSPQTVPVTLNINDAAKPDLVIETITWSPQNPSIGDTVTFTVAVKNQGSTQAGSSYVYYFIDGAQHTYDSVYSINPGASRTETFTWSVQEGVHTIVAIADYKGQVSESNETNNEKTLQNFGPNLSDLIVQSITWSPDHPSVGDTVTFTVTIKNQGNGDAASSKVYYFIDDSQQTYDSVYALDAGQTTTETFTWNAQEGTHTIRAVSDYANAVSESDESNNENIITYSATALPDLIVQSIDMTPENPEAGDSLTFTVILMNQGMGDAADSKVYYFIDDIQQGYDSVYALNVGSTTTETFSWTMTDGSHVLRAFIDYDNEVPESNEENNEKVIELAFSEEAISTPQIPAGTTSGTPGNMYEYYSGGASSNLDHEVEYRFDWGNGNYSAWSNVAAATYSWPTEDVYTIRTQARCAQHPDYTSDWSPGLIVTIEELDEITAEILDYEISPREVEINNPVQITLSLYNTGNVPWTFYAALSLRDPRGQEFHLPLKAVPLGVGQSGSAVWNYTINQEGSWDAMFGLWKESYQSTSLDLVGWLQSSIDCNDEDVTGYSIHFDVRNMWGFEDGTITEYDIQTYIAEKYPQSPMLVETDIGEVFVSAGIENDVNPAFLVATAELEGRFGTAGWSLANPEAHNTMGWGVYSSNTQIDSINSADTWGAMIERVAYYIAHGGFYYGSGRFTVDQIRKKYAAQPNSESIVSMMETLYSFAIENRDIDIEQSTLAQLIQQQATGGIPVTVDGQGYIILTLKNRIDPTTLQVMQNSGNTKVYVYLDRNEPVADLEIVRKIGLIDHANRLQNGIASAGQLSNALELMQDRMSTHKRMNLLLAIWDVLPTEWGTPATLIKGLLTEITGAIIEYIHEPQGEVRDICDRDFYEAEVEYEIALNISQGSAIDDYVTAENFLRMVWQADSLMYLSFGLLNKIDEIEKSTLDLIIEKDIETVTSGLIDIIQPVFTKAEANKWADEYQVQRNIEMRQVEQKLDERIWEATGYTLELAQNPRITSEVHSPVELRVYDSEQRVTGLVNGEEKNEIPYSIYSENSVTIFFPNDSYRYEVVGTDEGSYDLVVTSIAEETESFSLLEVSTSAKAVHDYTLDWDVISEGGEGITMKIDSDGDGNFERTINLSGIDSKGGGPFWVWICVGVVIGLGGAFVVWRYLSVKIRRCYEVIRNKIKYISKVRNRHNGSPGL